MDHLTSLLETFAATVHGVLKTLPFPKDPMALAHDEGPVYLVDVRADGRPWFHSAMVDMYHQQAHKDALLAAGLVEQGLAILAALPLSSKHPDMFSCVRMVCSTYDRANGTATCSFVIGSLEIDVEIDGTKVTITPFAWKIDLLGMLTYEGTPHTYRFDRPYGGERRMAQDDAEGTAGRNGYVRAHNPQDALLLIAIRMDDTWEADLFLMMAGTVWKEEKLADRGAFRAALKAHADLG